MPLCLGCKAKPVPAGRQSYCSPPCAYAAKLARKAAQRAEGRAERDEAKALTIAERKAARRAETEARRAAAPKRRRIRNYQPKPPRSNFKPKTEGRELGPYETALPAGPRRRAVAKLFLSDPNIVEAWERKMHESPAYFANVVAHPLD